VQVNKLEEICIQNWRTDLHCKINAEESHEI